MRNPDRLVVLVVAAEASGDRLGASLMQDLERQTSGAVKFVGVGGPAMKAAGLVTDFDISPLSVVGVFDGLRVYGHVRRAVRHTAELAAEHHPDVAILIDSWGLTIRIAEELRRRFPSMLVVKYVGPQVWAHRPGRAKNAGAVYDQILVTSPLDLPYYSGVRADVRFVGNPALAFDVSSASGERFRAQSGIGSGPLLLLLPGSRPSEINRLMPTFGEAARLVCQQRPDVRTAVVIAESVREQVLQAVTNWPVAPVIVEGESAKKDAMQAATASLACSGTVTTELAIAKSPMVVAYRLGPLTHAVLKRMYKPRFITMLNIAADRAVVPEFVQADCNPANLANALLSLLNDPAARSAQLQEQRAALDKLGVNQNDPTQEATRAIRELLASRRQLESDG